MSKKLLENLLHLVDRYGEDSVNTLLEAYHNNESKVINFIAVITCNHYGIALSNLYSSRWQHKDTATKRMFICLVKEYAGLKDRDIGKLFTPALTDKRVNQILTDFKKQHQAQKFTDKEQKEFSEAYVKLGADVVVFCNNKKLRDK